MGWRKGRAADAHPVCSRQPVDARFAPYGWEDLLREVEEYCDGREGGGGLYGHVEADGTIVVSAVSGCGDYTERSYGEIHLSYARLLSLERPGVRLVGDWHSHDERAVCPSPTDELGWAASIRAGLGAYVGVIVSPRDVEDFRWAWPNVSAWINTRERGCRLATIERS